MKKPVFTPKRDVLELVTLQYLKFKRLCHKNTDTQKNKNSPTERNSTHCNTFVQMTIEIFRACMMEVEQVCKKVPLFLDHHDCSQKAFVHSQHGHLSS